MNALFNLFRPAPYIEEIKDEEVVEEKYNYWRIRILYSTFVGYALYYFTRKSFSLAMPGLITELGYSKSQLGILLSIFSIAYGVSKFASGVLSDKSNPRYFMAFGLFMTGVLNICLGMSSSLAILALCWGLNGWFQGFGWPPCARFLTHWYSQSERGRWWAAWNVSHNVGAAIIPLIAIACTYFWDWRSVMYVPGVICILGSFFLINRLRDTPQSLGLPSIEKHRADFGGQTEDEAKKERQLSTREILFEYVLKNKFIWILASSYFFVYIVRTGMNDWANVFLINGKGYSESGAYSCAFLFEVGGFCGSLFAGWSSDKIFGARRGPVNVLFVVGMVWGVVVLWSVPQGFLWLDSIAMFLMGFSIFGPQMLIGVAAAELSHKNAAATATGFTGWVAYMGAAVAGYPLGLLLEKFGWEGFFIGMSTCCLISILLLIPMWNVKDRSQLTVKAKPKYA